MSKLYFFVAVIFSVSLSLLPQQASAQAPEKMSYQAVVRDASNMIVSNQTVGIKISVLQGAISGPSVYEETHTPMSNANGLVTLEIGDGNVLLGTFNGIDWSIGPYFIKTETDPNGGTAYTITGTSQLMSVPYALHANTADSIVGGVNINETDPVFAASIANGITAADTANWNNHILDTQLDSAGVAALGFVAGPHTVEVDGSVTNEIQDLQLMGNNLTITNNGSATTIDLSPYLDDTQLDSSDVAALGFVAGPHTVEVDGSVTNEIQDLQLVGNNLTITNNGTATTLDLSPYLDNTDTQIDSAGIAALGFVAGPHTNAMVYLGMARAKNEGSPNPNANNAVPTNTSVKIPWTSVSENYGNSIGGSNNTTITIPAGVTYMRLNATIIYDQITTTSESKSTFVLYKNGNPFGGLTNSGYMTYQHFNSLYGFNCHTTLIPVVPGDEFEVQLFQTSGSTLYLSWGSISSAVAFEFYAQ